MKFQIQTKVKVAILSPLFLIHWMLYRISENRPLIDSDIRAWEKYRDFVDIRHLQKSLFLLLVLQNEFRAQFTLRLGTLGNLLPFYSGKGLCDLGRCKNIGEGFVLMHGFGVVINGGG